MSLLELPNLDDPCGRHFVYRDFIECGTTWQSTGVDNVPVQPDTYVALSRLATSVLDPTIDQFGQLNLTYGLSCKCLLRRIKSGIAPRLDQHASHEMSAAGKPICERGGAACDFLVNEINALTVAHWIVSNTDFDRLYYYGSSMPIHVSAAENPKRQCVLVNRDPETRRVLPSAVSINKFLEITKDNEGEEQ